MTMGLNCVVLDARVSRVPTRPPAHARAYRSKTLAWDTECATSVTKVELRIT
jgi:hypothetical protein